MLNYGTHSLRHLILEFISYHYSVPNLTLTLSHYRRLAQLLNFKFTVSNPTPSAGTSFVDGESVFEIISFTLTYLLSFIPHGDSDFPLLRTP